MLKPRHTIAIATIAIALIAAGFMQPGKQNTNAEAESVHVTTNAEAQPLTAEQSAQLLDSIIAANRRQSETLTDKMKRNSRNNRKNRKAASQLKRLIQN